MNGANNGEIAAPAVSNGARLITCRQERVIVGITPSFVTCRQYDKVHFCIFRIASAKA